MAIHTVSLQGTHIPTAESRAAGRWNNNRGVAFYAVYEVGPPVHVPQANPARLRHRLDLRGRKHSIPDIDVCQHPLEGLTGTQASSD